MKINNSSITKQPLKQIRLLGTAHVSNKAIYVFVPEEKRFTEDIKDTISNWIKVSYRWTNHKIGKDILKSYYYFDNWDWFL